MPIRLGSSHDGLVPVIALHAALRGVELGWVASRVPQADVEAIPGVGVGVTVPLQCGGVGVQRYLSRIELMATFISLWGKEK